MSLSAHFYNFLAVAKARLGMFWRYRPSVNIFGGLQQRLKTSISGWRWSSRLVGGFAGLIVLYILLGMALVHRIDDNSHFVPVAETANGAKTVDMAVALLDREINKNYWVANDPFFLPGYWLDNMPAFQQGIVYALSRFSVQLSDQLGRARGSSQLDPDLDRAVGFLKYPGNVWLFNWSVSWLPTASSEATYRSAMRHFAAYNQRVATGQALYDRRADNLMAALDSIASDLGSQSAILENQLLLGGGFFSWHADTVYYNAKGRLYAYSRLIDALGQDFKDVIAQRDIAALWQGLVQSLTEAATLQPLIVCNAAPDNSFLPSHLAAQGFYLLRARTQLREITNVLSK